MHFVQIMQHSQVIQTKSGYLDVDKQQNGSFAVTPARIELMHSREYAQPMHMNIMTQRLISLRSWCTRESDSVRSMRISVTRNPI